MSTIIRNKQFALYTKGAAAQFKMTKMYDDIGDDKKMEAWFLFVDAAKVLSETGGQSVRNYDWKNKVTIRLGIPDIGMFLNAIRLGCDPEKNGGKKFEIYHDPGKGSANEGKVAKAMGLQKGQSYGYMINFREKKGDQTNSFAVPITDEQLIIFKLLLERAAILITGFYDAATPIE